VIHDELRLSLGALLVGSLPEPEKAEVRAHLDVCDDCRAAYDEISGLVGLLATVSASEAKTGPPQPTDAMLDSMLATVRAERLRRRWRSVGLAAAAAVGAAAIATGVTVAVDRGDGAAEPVAAATVTAADSQTGVAAEIDLGDKAWGTAVVLAVRGVEAGYTCSLVAVGSDGSREVAASWTVPASRPASDADRPLTVPGSVGLQRGTIDHFEVVEDDGTVLLTLPLDA
jgi:predicted anti-sigma-YlaC factor YlaD